jgi:predicted type IV restriction endonuclease
MIKREKHRTDLQVPPIVREQWEKGTNEKNELAALLMSVNWDKDRKDSKLM